MNQSIKGPIAVAVSGGMDSLYSLLSLRDQGYEVFPLHALFLPPELRKPDAADALQRLKDCVSSFGFKLHVADLSERFEELVIRPFVQAYLVGKTPNPCAKCNPNMKFGLLLAEAERLGAAHIATGHYVQLVEETKHARAPMSERAPAPPKVPAARALDEAGPDDNARQAGTALNARPETGRTYAATGPAIYAGEDESKDQSYFLSLTPLAQLAKAVFPLARRIKKDIAAELAARGIEVPQKGESQEICFIPNDDYRAFLEDYARRSDLQLPGRGEVLLPDGKPIAEHRGLWNYTQGQRQGLGIAWKEPLYVLGKDVARNNLLVGPRSSFTSQPVVCSAPNCLVPAQHWPETMLVKTRYRQHPQPARAIIEEAGGKQRLIINFIDDTPQAPVAPGQIAALYQQTEQGLRLLAGAEIL